MSYEGTEGQDRYSTTCRGLNHAPISIRYLKVLRMTALVAYIIQVVIDLLSAKTQSIWTGHISKSLDHILTPLPRSTLLIRIPDHRK